MKYKPEKILRSLFVIALSFIFGAAGAFAVVSKAQFTDVNYDSWYGDSVNRFAELKILQGYEDDTYRPNEYVNRAELAVILSRFLEKVGGDLASGGVCLKNDTIYLSGEGYYDGCNWNTCNNGRLIGTEMGCETHNEQKNTWEK